MRGKGLGLIQADGRSLEKGSTGRLVVWMSGERTIMVIPEVSCLRAGKGPDLTMARRPFLRVGSLSPHDQAAPDLFVGIVGERNEGIVVSGYDPAGSNGREMVFGDPIGPCPRPSPCQVRRWLVNQDKTGITARAFYFQATFYLSYFTDHPFFVLSREFYEISEYSTAAVLLNLPESAIKLSLLGFQQTGQRRHYRLNLSSVSGRTSDGSEEADSTWMFSS